VRLEPLYRVTFTTPESWSVEFEGTTGTDGITVSREPAQVAL
jgi:hypothetical protein